MVGADILYPPTPTHGLRGGGGAATSSSSSSAVAAVVPVVTPLTKLGFPDIISPTEVNNSSRSRHYHHRLSTQHSSTQQQSSSSSTQQHQQQQQQPLTVQEYQQKLEQALYDAECNLEMERTNRSLQLVATAAATTTSVTAVNNHIDSAEEAQGAAAALGIQFQKINVNNHNNHNHSSNNSNEFYGYNSDDNSLLLDESTIAERSSLVGGDGGDTTTDDDDTEDDTASFVRGSTVGNSTVLSEFTRDTTTEYTRDTTTEYTRDTTTEYTVYSTTYNSEYTTETNEMSTKKDSSNHHHNQTLLPTTHSSYSRQQKEQLQKLNNNIQNNNGGSSSHSRTKKTPRVRFDLPKQEEVKNDTTNKEMTLSPWCMMYGKNNITKDDDTLTYDGGATYNDDDEDEDDDTLAVMKRVVTCRPWGAEFVNGGANGGGNGIVGEDDCETITTRDTRSIVSGGSTYSRSRRRGRGKDGGDDNEDTTTIYTGYTRDTKRIDDDDDDAGTAKVIEGEQPYCQGGFIGGGAGSEVRPPPPPPIATTTTTKPCTPKSSFPWMCAPGCMGGYVHEEKEITYVGSVIRVGNSSPDRSNARAASSVISATTRGTVNSNESNITQLTENIKKIMAASSAREATTTTERYNRASLNSTLDEKLQAVKGRDERNHVNGMTSPKDQMRKDASYFWKLDDSSSFLEKLKAADRSRSQDDVARRMVPNATRDGKTTSSFWKGDGLWSSDQSTSFGDSTINSTHLPKMNVMLREYDEARERSLAFMQNDAPKNSYNVPKLDHDVAKMNAWMTVIDHSTGKPYWFNQVTRETSWKSPYDENNVSNHWKTAKDPSTGKTYYYNKMTQETCWKKPRGYKTEGGSDKNGRSVVANEMNRNEALLQQGTDLSRMRTQKQRGGGRVFMEENGIIIGSKTRPSHSASVRFAEAQSNDDVNLSRRRKEERDQYWISQSKKSIGKQPSGNHHQQQHRYNQQYHEEVGQEKNSSRRRRLSLFYKKKSSTKEKQPSSTTPSYSSPRPTLNSKSYNKATTVDPESPDRTAETIPSRGSDGSEPCGIVVDGVTTFSI